MIRFPAYSIHSSIASSLNDPFNQRTDDLCLPFSFALTSLSFAMLSLVRRTVPPISCYIVVVLVLSLALK